MLNTETLHNISFHLRVLCNIRAQIDRLDLYHDTSNEAFSQSSRLLITTLKYLSGLCQRNNLSDSCDQTGRAASAIEHAIELWKITNDTKITRERIESQLDIVSVVFNREAKNHQFAHISPNKARILLLIDEEWSLIWKKFPSAKASSRSAVEAYAVGLNDASVYHMMIVLESGLKTLARRLAVKYDRETWDKIIKKMEDAIQSAINARRNTVKGSKPPTPAVAARSRADITFFATAATEFIWFKEAWRNHVAHGRAQYDEVDPERATAGAAF